MAKKIFVSPSGKNWKVKLAKNDRASYVFDTKAEAMKKGIEMAKKNNAELFIQKRDGTIGEKNSYGNDPREIKG
jgi:hypothetical protein